MVKIHFKGQLAYIYIWEEAELILWILVAKEKNFQGVKVFYFRDSGEINALFLGTMGTQTP